MMNDWFEWNGVRCTEYGIHVAEQPPLTIPAERVTYTNVPGRSGSLATLEGDDVYDDMTLTATCFISDPTRIPQIAAWLKGSGTVTFANRQGGFYYARVTNQISFEKILRGNPHRAFAINFRCKPFWYAEGAEPITLTQSSTFISNPGSVYAEPVVTINGSGDITSALFTAHLHTTGDPALALARTASSVFGVLRTTLESGERELQIIAGQEHIAHPAEEFEVERVR